MTDRKIKILMVSDWGDTGFGTVMKELLWRLNEMEIFDLHYHGWHAQPSHAEEANQYGATLHLTHFWDGGDQFGQKSFDSTVERVKPDIVMSLGDPWMIEHIPNSRFKNNFFWVCYVPVDRDGIVSSWLNPLKRADALVLFSKFGKDVMDNHLPFTHTELILHGVDRTIFKPFYPEGMDEDTPYQELMNKRRAILGDAFKDRFIVGFVGRNQVRKAIPRIFKAFKAFNCKTWTNRDDVIIVDENGVKLSFETEEFCRRKQCFRCDVCPAFQQREELSESVLYLHTTDGTTNQDRPGIGWNLQEITKRFDLLGRVAFTPSLTALKGVPRGVLSQIYQCFDAHCFITHSEGFGLPAAESVCCGIPTIVTNYSSMPELVSSGGGVAIDPIDFDTFTFWDNEWANADIGDTADELDKIYSDPEYRDKVRKEGAENTYIPDWHEVALNFRKLFLKAIGREVN